MFIVLFPCKQPKIHPQAFPCYRNQEKAFSFPLQHVKKGRRKKAQVKSHSSIKLVLCTEWFDYAVDVTCVYSVTSTVQPMCVSLATSIFFFFTIYFVSTTWRAENNHELINARIGQFLCVNIVYNARKIISEHFFLVYELSFFWYYLLWFWHLVLMWILKNLIKKIITCWEYGLMCRL